jgi:magnesium-transporting ATPase (P-type)
MPPKATEADVEKGSKTSGADDPQWHAMTKEDAAARLGVSPNIRHQGLTSAEAKARLEEYGYNALTEKEKVTLLQRIWKQVNNVLVGILVFVAVVSLLKGIVSEDGEDKVTNFIEVGLISFVIT